MSAVIEVSELTKYYGKNRGVESLTFSVDEGEVFGFLGPNGAGKTTTIRCLLGMLRATSGSMSVLGDPVTLDGSRLRGRIGYVPGEVHLYERETGRWLLDYVAGFRGGRRDIENELVERLEFDPGRKIKELSKGNKQKLALIIGLAHDPELLILDEPTSGLDPLNQEVVFDIIEERVQAGSSVFFSSHILSEVERVCDKVGIVREGSLVALECMDDLLAERRRVLRVRFGSEEATAALGEVEGVGDIVVSGATAEATVDAEAIGRLVERLARETVLDLEIERRDLEEVFLEYYRHEVPDDRATTVAGGGAS